MVLLHGAAALATILLGTWVGARLLLLARRTRRVPELLVGTGLVSFAAVAYPLSIAVATAGDALPPSARIGLRGVTWLAYVVPVFALGAFTQRMFRPEAAWARALWVLLGLVATAGAALLLRASWTLDGAAAATGASLGGRLVVVAYTVVFSWTAAEALTYHTALRRRLRLGLADPVLVHRFLLWGAGASVGAAVDAALLAIGFRATPPPAWLTDGLQAISGLANAVTWWLSFSPPPVYVAWVRRAFSRTQNARTSAGGPAAM